MTTDPIFGKVVRFAVPLAASNMLQLLFNAADVVIAGRFIGSGALAAVGSTTYLIALFVNFFIGMSIGVNVIAARAVGARDDAATSRSIHTAMTLALVFGAGITALGQTLAPTGLEMMGTPEGVIGQATKYIRIYLAGAPFVIIYNFGSAILKAAGDTKRPLIYLTIAGAVNVPMNVFFVVVVGMDASGVALATVIAQGVSAVLVVRCLLRADGAYRLTLKKMSIDRATMGEVFRIGIPAGIANILFSLSNVLIQTEVNSFGAAAMAGSTASVNVGSFVYLACNSVYQANLSFTGQNIGAKKYSRIRKILRVCVGTVTGVGVTIGLVALLFSRQIISLYTTDPEVLAFGLARLRMIIPFYFLCGIMDTIGGSVRAMGHPTIPTAVTMICVCGVRILWIHTVFAAWPTITVLYGAYMTSWIVTSLAHLLCFIHFERRLPREEVFR